MQITGKIVRVNISGGFWGIEGDDGRKYQPSDSIPSRYQRDGLKIKAEVQPSNDFTIFMWGQSVKVSRIEAL